MGHCISPAALVCSDPEVSDVTVVFEYKKAIVVEYPLVKLGVNFVATVSAVFTLVLSWVVVGDGFVVFLKCGVFIGLVKRRSVVDCCVVDSVNWGVVGTISRVVVSWADVPLVVVIELLIQVMFGLL